MSKSIIISGKKNRDKLLNPNITHKRDITKKCSKKWFESKNQIEIINNLYLDLNHETKQFSNDELNKKIRSYKVQDEKKDIFNRELFISRDEVLEKLVSCKLKCFYCFCNLSFLYQNVRQKDQWTLDRINNDLGHNNNNVVISCLNCNLKRRTTDQTIFKQFRKVTVKKSE